MLTLLGLIPKTYEETYRETWIIGCVEVVIDEWPKIMPLVEIEGPTENSVKKVVEILRFDFVDSVFLVLISFIKKN
jgi:adenylate cyclase class 2